MRKHSVWKLGSQETGVMQPSVMFVDFVHISLFLGGKGIKTKLTVIFLPLSTRRGTSGASTGAEMFLPCISRSSNPPSMSISLRIQMVRHFVTK